MTMTHAHQAAADQLVDQLFTIRTADPDCAASIGAEAIEAIEKVLIGLSNDDLAFAQAQAGQLIRSMREALPTVAPPHTMPGDVIGLGGRLRSGKDAFADHLVAHHGYVKVGMSDVLLEHLLIVNPWIKVTLREAFRLRTRPGFQRAQSLVGRLGYVNAKTVRDFRTYMQKDGTDAGRNFFGEGIWVHVISKRVAALVADGKRVVLTGLRYPNELGMARSVGATALWVSRPAVEAAPGDHSSENSLTPADFDLVIDNSGTLDQLYQHADEVAASPAREPHAA